MFLEYTKKKLINKSIVEYLQVKNQDIISHISVPVLKGEE